MPKASPIINAFNGGEVTPLLKGRTDFKKYAFSLETCENMLPLIQGGAMYRPGTKYVAEVKASSKDTILRRFEFSTTQAYIIEIGDQYMRFYKDNGQIESGGSPYEIVTPYLEAEIRDLKFAQSADVLYIAHPNHAPRKLTRTGHTAWTLTEITFDWPPFLDENSDTSITITASAVTGTGITLTASQSIFTADHVGAVFKLSELVESKHRKWKAEDGTNPAWSVNDLCYYDGLVYKLTSKNGYSSTGNDPPVHLEGTETDKKFSWQYLHPGAGYVEITAYSSGTSVTATVISRLPDSTTSGVDTWSEGAWSDEQGYPRTVTFYNNRLWWAGTAQEPQTLWGSAVGQYENLDEEYQIVDDSPMRLTINAANVNVIQWMMDDEKGLVVGTTGGEWVIGPATTNNPFSPTNFLAKRSTAYGSNDAQAIRAAKAIMFVQRDSRRVREMAYILQDDGFDSADLTELAEHVTQTGIEQLEYQQSYHSVVWARRSDGVLAGMSYNRKQDVVGWHRHIIAGSSDADGTNAVVESIDIIPSSDGTTEELWMIVKRYIDGSIVRYVEYMTPWWQETLSLTSDAFFVDSGLTYSGAAATTISGLDHLEGETVSILRDGCTHPTRTVTSGEITLDEEGSLVHVGLGYTGTLKTMPIEAGAADGTAQGKTKRIHRAILRVHETSGFNIGTEADNLYEFPFRNTDDPMGTATPLFTGDKEVDMEGGYDKEGQIIITHDQPAPFTALALIIQLNTQDR